MTAEFRLGQRKMNTRALTFLTSVFVLSSAAQAQVISPTHAGLALSAAQSKVLSGSESFVENKGQWDGRVQFLARSPGLNMWITDEGMVMDYHQFVPDRVQTREQGNKFWRPNGTIYGDVVKFTLENTQPTAFTGDVRLQGDLNYFIGNDPGMWASSVHRFAEAKAENPYPGIAVRYYFDKNSPRYDLMLKPGADPSQVSFKVEGVQGMRVRPDGSLELKTPYGTISENGLAAYQLMNGQKTQISCSLAVDGDRIRFDAGQYDPAKPLIIDPLIFSTYLGPTEADADGTAVYGLALDRSGNPVATGLTSSTHFPTISGAYLASNKADVEMAFVSKLSADGSQLLASTYLGSTGDCEGHAIAVDAAGDLFVAGYCRSSDFPTTAGAFQTVALLEYSCFVSKLSGDCTQLLASTFLAGDSVANPEALTLDKFGDPVVAGSVGADGFPTTSGAYQRGLKGTDENAFVSKLSSDLTKLLASTYLGGTDYDVAFAIALDASGNPVVAGWTGSADFPTTPGAYQTGNKGSADAFVAKLSADETKLVASTTLGGSSIDCAYGVTVDASGNPIIAGETFSPDFPTTPGAYQRTKQWENGDCFISRLSADGTKLLASTFLGGSGDEEVSAICLSPLGNLVLTGFTESQDFPTTPGAYQMALKGGESTFLTELSSDESTLLYSTFMGGSSQDEACALALDALGNPVMAGVAHSKNFPITSDAFQSQSNEVNVGFVDKFEIPPFFIQAPNSVYGPAQVQGSIVSTQEGATIDLSGSPASLVTVPEVTLPSGSYSTSFGFSVGEVDSNTVVTITGTLGSTKESTTFTLTPIPVSSLTMPASCVGGKSIEATVTGAAVFGAGFSGVVSLSANSSVVTIPKTATIPSGSGQVSFQVSTVLVAETTPVQITATLSGVSKTATMDVQPVSSIKELTLLTPCVGGATIEGVISCATYVGPLGGIVTLSSNGPEAVVPASVTIPPGGYGLLFHFSTKAVTKPTYLIISASYGGVTKQANLTILPAP